MRPARLLAGLVLAAGVGAAGLWTVVGYRTATLELGAAAQTAIARLLKVPRDQVQIGRARLALPARVVLEDVRLAGAIRIGRMILSLDPLRAATAQAAPTAVELEDLEGPGGLRAARVRGERRAHGLGLVIEGLGYHPSDARTLPLTAARLDLEIDRGRVLRAAMSGGRIGGYDGWSGLALADAEGGLLVRMARDGATLSGRLHGGALRGRVELSHLPLGPLPHPPGVELQRATAGGPLALVYESGVLRLEGQLRLDGLALAHPALASDSLRLPPLAVGGAVSWSEAALELGPLQVRAGDLELELAATLPGGAASGRAFSLDAELKPSDCAALFTALPEPLTRPLRGLEVAGHLRGRVAMRRTARSADLDLSTNLEVGCRVLTDSPLADPRTLAAPLEVEMPGAPGAPMRRVLLGPRSPTYRRLEALPARLIGAILVAEDGRFFQHHGFDELRIRGALAADLEREQLGRGASTISQQLVKNLFLSGERSFGRKLAEAILTWRVEQAVPKARLLELYLNLVELGPGIYGVVEGAERYFGKEPEELTLDEAADLAALLPAPRRGMDAGWQTRRRLLGERLAADLRRLHLEDHLRRSRGTRRAALDVGLL